MWNCSGDGGIADAREAPPLLSKPRVGLPVLYTYGNWYGTDI